MRSLRRSVTGRYRSLVWLLSLVLLAQFTEARNYVDAYNRHAAREQRIEAAAKRLGMDPELLKNPSGKRGWWGAMVSKVAGFFGTEEKDAATPEGRANLWKERSRVVAQASLPAQLDQINSDLLAVKGILDQMDHRGGAPQPGEVAALGAHLRSLSRAAALDRIGRYLEGCDLDGASKGALRDVQNALRLAFASPTSLLPINAQTTARDMLRNLPQVKEKGKGRETTGKGRREGKDLPNFRAMPEPALQKIEVTKEEMARPSIPSVSKVSSTEGASSGGRAAPGAKSDSGSATRGAGALARQESSPSLVALAQSLDNLPSKIFNFVHDDVEFEPYFGVAKGAEGTLLEMKGSDADQAALLMGLLQAAGFEAQYQWGKVDLTVKQAKDLTGVDDIATAAGLLATAGYNAALLTLGSAPVGVRMDHIWVKARVPYTPHRGARAGTPDTWVLMDPSIKSHTQTAGIAINGHVTFQYANYINAAQTRVSPMDSFKEALWAYLRGSGQNCADLSQVMKLRTLKPSNFPYLPGTLPVKPYGTVSQGTSLPASLTLQATVDLEDPYGEGGAVIQQAFSLPDIYGKKLALRYAGTGTQRVPTLELEDAPVATGTAATIGDDFDLYVRFTIPQGLSRTVSSQGHHFVIAGETLALAINGGDVPASVINARIKHWTTQSGTAALTDQLAVAGLRYTSELEDALQETTGLKAQRYCKFPVEGAVARLVHVSYLWGIPVGITDAEYNVDMPHIVVGLFPVDGNTTYKRETFNLAGAQSSYLENALWEEMLSQEGISAVKALTLAKSQNQTVFTVAATQDLNGTLANPSNGITLTTDQQAELANAHRLGKTVIFSQSPVTLNAWTGAGFIEEDPVTGAATYLILGGTASAGGSSTGGATGGAPDALGSEPWLQGTPLGDLLAQLMALLGGGGGSNIASGGSSASSIQADPVNLATGNFLEQATDLTQQARGIPVAFSRTYNSRSSKTGPLGYGWTFNYNQNLAVNPGLIVYTDEDGTEHVFTETSPGVFAAPPGKHLYLVSDGGGAGYTMTSPEGMATHFLSSGKLDSFEDTNGNRVALAYDGGGHLSSITDAAGRAVLTFTTSADGLITAITNDPAGIGGRSVSFAYTPNADGLADLTGVTDTLGHVWPYTYDTNHNLSSKADPLGNTNFYFYDALDRLVEHVDPLGASESFAYDPGNREASVTDKNGNVRGLKFDERGRGMAGIDPLGNETRVTWDADNNMAQATDARGGVTANTYDANGNVLTSTDPSGNQTVYTYDPVLNRQLTVTQHNGAQTLLTTNTYDSAGNLLTTQAPGGGTTTNTYDSHGQLLTTEDPLHRTTTMVWDSTKGSLVSQTNPAGGTTTVATDDYGRIQSFTDPSGETITVGMNAKDQMVSMTDPQGNVTGFGYDAAGRRVTQTTPRGTTTTGYDGLGRVLSTTDVLGNVTRSAYDAMGNVLTRTDALGNTWTTTYDALGRSVSSKDPAGNVTSYGYCANLSGGGAGCSTCGGGGGSFCVVTDAMGNVTKQDLDIQGRVTSVTDPLGYVTQFTYDALGRKLSQTDPENHTTRYEYDVAGRLTAVVEANSARTEYTYDLAGNKLTQKDANSHSWTYTYTAMNQIETETDPLGHVTTYHYNTAGQLTSKVTPNNQTITYSYTHRRLTGITHDGITESFAYDTQGRKTGMSNPETDITYQYDNLNRLLTLTDNKVGRSVSFVYDANGNKTQMTIQAGATVEAVVKSFYDSLGRLGRQEDSRTGVFQYGYDALSRRTQLSYPNGVKASYQYDKASHLTALLNMAQDGTTLDGYSYTYNKAGMRTSMTTTGTALGAAAGFHGYAYDPTYKLTEANYPGGRFEHFTYDNVGNRLALSDDKGATGYTYNEMNQLLTESRVDTGAPPVLTQYGYDNSGNTVSKQAGSSPATTYQWDALNRLIALTESSGAQHSFAYDPNGIRARMTENGSILRFLLAGEDIVEDLSPNGSSFDVATYYSHGPGIDEPLAQFKANATIPGYLHHDALGSVTAMTNNLGVSVGANVYNAYGTVANDLLPSSLAKVDSRYGYTSRELDETTLMYYRSRYLSHAESRMLTKDFYAGREERPASLNRYQYAECDPILYSDPHGLATYNCDYTMIQAGWRGLGAGIIWWNCQGTPTTTGVPINETGLSVVAGITLGPLPIAGAYSSITLKDNLNTTPELMAELGQLEGGTIFFSASFVPLLGGSLTFVSIGAFDPNMPLYMQTVPGRLIFSGRTSLTLMGIVTRGWDAGIDLMIGFTITY